MVSHANEGHASSSIALPDTRTVLAEQYLTGSGIEIGALHHPLRVPRHVTVRYVDRMSVDDLRRHYPELNDKPLVPVHIVDNGETLSRVDDASQDFIIANHFLEHCQDPIGTIKQMFRVLKPNGILFLTLPDKRYTFDEARAVTPLAHLWKDHLEGPEGSRLAHFEDYVRHVGQTKTEEDYQALLQYALQHDTSIHFHVWTQREMIEMFLDLTQHLPIEFEVVQKHGMEVIFILRKRPKSAASTQRLAA